MSQEETISTTVIKLSTAVQEAKNWFGDQEEFIVETDYILARGKSITKTINWQNAVVYNDEKTVEVELNYNNHWVPVRRGETTQSEIKDRKSLAFYRLMLDKKDDGDYEIFLLKYFPNSENDNQKRLDVNNYFSLSNKFTGEIWMHNWEEEFLKGWKIEHGKIVKTFFKK
ncbi:hypothetical protein [Algoriphagus sp.]